MVSCLDGNRPEPVADPSRPFVTVVAPLYESQATLPGFLHALGSQTYRPFEVILVDSSPSDACERLVRELAPGFVYLRSTERLLPHAARSAGIRQGQAALVVFTDPDVYAGLGWLERLVETHLETGHVVVGSLACHGRRWLDQGIHLTKFSKWLPGGSARPVDMSPTANMLVPRALFESAGGFGSEPWQGDTLLSWRLRERGVALWFEPRACVAHHHLDTLRGFLAERFRRGSEYGRVRLSSLQGGTGTAGAYLLATVLPIRILSNLGHVAWHATRARRLGMLLATFPIVLLGFSASLLGEARAYAGGLLRRGS